MSSPLGSLASSSTMRTAFVSVQGLTVVELAKVKTTQCAKIEHRSKTSEDYEIESVTYNLEEAGSLSENTSNNILQPRLSFVSLSEVKDDSTLVDEGQELSADTKRSRMKRNILLAFTFWVNITSTGGCVYGLPVLTGLMDQELEGWGQLWQKCTSLDDCTNRDQIYANAFISAIAVMSASAALFGVIIDH